MENITVIEHAKKYFDKQYLNTGSTIDTILNIIINLFKIEKDTLNGTDLRLKILTTIIMDYMLDESTSLGFEYDENKYKEQGDLPKKEHKKFLKYLSTLESDSDIILKYSDETIYQFFYYVLTREEWNNNAIYQSEKSKEEAINHNENLFRTFILWLYCRDPRGSQRNRHYNEIDIIYFCQGLYNEELLPDIDDYIEFLHLDDVMVEIKNAHTGKYMSVSLAYQFKNLKLNDFNINFPFKDY